MRVQNIGLVATSLCIPHILAAPVDPECNDLPLVDLGYVRQQATNFNATGKYYNFTNVAFAEPPIGELRFAAPRPPKFNPEVQNGQGILPQCPQGFPLWLNGGQSRPSSPTETEDCLYLDVIVPEETFKSRGRPSSPVVVWIYGGGFVLGSKTLNGGGNWALDRNRQDPHSKGVIFVAMNYRVGSFGFLGGEDFQNAGGVANAGLLDQRLALEWVQQNIVKFGGDPKKITVIGESGGASSIGYHMIAGGPGNAQNTPFQQTIFQSPATLPEFPTDVTLNQQLSTLLKTLNVSTLEQAKRVDTKIIQEANRNIIQNAPQGSFAYGPSNDGSYVTESLLQGLAKGRFNREIKSMIAYNSNEGDIFAPLIDANFSFLDYVSSILPTASQAAIMNITNDLYPVSRYPEISARAVAFIGDAWVYGNVYALQKAFHGKASTYEFSLGLGYHTEDLSYTFYQGTNEPTSSFYPVNSSVAIDMQKYFINFAVHSDPNVGAPGAPQIPQWGQNGHMLNLTDDGIAVVDDPHRGAKYEFWANLQ